MCPSPRQSHDAGKFTTGSDGNLQSPPLPAFPPECMIETTISSTNKKKKKVPGIYRLMFEQNGNKYVWIGMTDDLQRCPFKDYCSPAEGVERDNVVHDAVVDAGGAIVEVIPECELRGTTRHNAEIEEQSQAIEENQLLLNKCKKKCGLGYGHYLTFKKDYHQRMARKAERELELWNAIPRS
jgi:hypothetical protein